ncbi:MAG: hypothetical protein Q8K59_13190 [Nitrosomonas sp.]|nr:hypothetical protein [Nitrosomonas sp.]MDP1952013.1 hypothetical protein [Nitrosomonas sp.]
MHDYSIDKHPKEKVLFFLALIAITAAPIIKGLAEVLVSLLEVSTGWSSAPVVAIPVFGLFAGLYFLFDKYLWKISWLRKVLLVPDLNGKWSCDGHTNLKNAEPVGYDWKATISITQSWSKILIHLKTSQSESKSISASIYHEAGVGYRLLEKRGRYPLLLEWKQPCEPILDWSAWLAENDDPQELEVLRRNAEKGLPCGADKFIRGLEKVVGRPLHYRPLGRPKKEKIIKGSVPFSPLFQTGVKYVRRVFSREK